MMTAPSDMLLALNSYAGVRRVQLRGKNAAISNAAETVWSPGATYARLSSATAMEAISSSANDAAAGTGARTIRVEGVSASYVEQSETVTLNGTNAVALSGSYIAINSVRVLTAGSGGTNAGTIDIRTVAGSVIKCQISTDVELGLGQSACFVYTVPSGCAAILKSISFSATGVTGDLSCYLSSVDSTGILRAEGAGKSSLYVTGFNGAIGSIDFGIGRRFEPGTLLELRAIVSAGAGALVAMSELFLVKPASTWIGAV